MGKKEKWAVIVFLFLCTLLPFGMVRSPIEIGSHVIPLWGCYYGFVGWWAYTGKPFWQSFLACYGIASFGIIMLYLGIGVIQIAFAWIKNYFGKFFPVSLNKKKKITEKKKNGKSKRFASWLGKQSIWIILLCLFLPFFYTDPAATVAMKLKGVKYGLWYLLAVNLLHIYLIVWLVYEGLMPYLKEILPFFF